MALTPPDLRAPGRPPASRCGIERSRELLSLCAGCNVRKAPGTDVHVCSALLRWWLLRRGAVGRPRGVARPPARSPLRIVAQWAGLSGARAAVGPAWQVAVRNAAG